MTTDDKYKKLADKLRELFQLDQPDLDFGIYRVMHLKRDAVERYLDPTAPDGLRAAVEAVLSSTTALAANDALAKARAKVVEAFGADAIGANGALASGYAATPFGKAYVEAQAAALAAQGAAEGEKDVFDLLLDFFSRYYQGGDFVSKRHITRETDSRALSYAIPYGGEEVKLHWANADQYYIKTSENFSSYSFDLAESREIKALGDLWKTANGIPAGPLRVHFRIAAADEGEHNDTKPDEERFFFLDEAKPFEIADGELSVFFRHETDPKKTGKTKDWQKKLLDKAETTVLGALATAPDGPAAAFRSALAVESPTEKNNSRTVFARYLAQYAARNTEDYFVHKDLGAFLRRELEFYVKNEILNVSDLARQTDEALMAVSEAQLRRARAFYRVARRIVDDFLAPLEDFQKKLWLKRKFVIQCDWCVTLDIVEQNAPELLPEIFANEEQKEEWKGLGVEADPKADNLTATDARMVDTKFFNEDFKSKLLAAIPDLDARTDGVLVHSENFQALRLMQERYKEQIKCIYIDPPYNTGDDHFIYKDGYSHSSWLSMMEDRLRLAKEFLRDDALFWSSIDYIEVQFEKILLELVFEKKNFEGLVSWRRRHNQPNDKTKLLGLVSEYLLAYAKDAEQYKKSGVGKIDLTGDFSNPDNDPRGDWASKPWKVGSDQSGSRYKITAPDGTVYDEEWMGEEDTYTQLFREGRIYFPNKRGRGKNGDGYPRKKYYREERLEEGQCATNWWPCEQFGHNQGGNDVLTSLMGVKNTFTNPKPIELIRAVVLLSNTTDATILDFFAGSGTTAHSVIALNREDKGNRKYILIEMGKYFDTVLKRRIKKVVYSPEWKDGKPECTDKGISHCFKYLTLESYEDTLNNLCFDKEPKGADGVSDYLLRYMLETGTKGSPSLLDAAAFAHPFSCKLEVKKPGSEERETRTVDLVETFNWLIGLRVRTMSGTKRYSADFERMPDPDLPAEAEATRLRVKDKLRLDGERPFAFQTVEGTVPRDRAKPDGAMDKVIVVWRELTGDSERDNAVLDKFLDSKGINSRDFEYDLLYINGSNNVPCLRREDQSWKVQLIEETFLKRMLEDEGA